MMEGVGGDPRLNSETTAIIILLLEKRRISRCRHKHVEAARLCSCDSDRAHLCREHSAADIMAG